MPSATAPSRQLRWFWIPVRVLLVSFLLTLLTFAACLLLGIVGLLIRAGLRGVYPDMTTAYRQIALPIAVVAGAIAMVSAVAMEIRHYRRKEREPLT
jgi:hypothetical protein